MAFKFKTIDNFKLHEVLTDTDVIEETDRLGNVMRHKERVIMEGVTLFVFDSGQAALEMGDSTTLEFMYTEEMADILERMEEVDAFDFVKALERNGIEL